MSALDRLLKLPRFGPAGVNERMTQLVDGLEMVPSIKIVGSNGKGTTAHMMAQMASALGKTVGLYTSPHLLKVNERIQINAQMIDDEDLDIALSWALDRCDKINGVGRFEALTLAALYHFSQQNIDLAIMEIGLGGRFDPVRVAPGKISVLTSIDLEHTAILGNTVEQIAAEKAAVCKAGDTLFSAVSGIESCVPDGVIYRDIGQPPLAPLQSNARLAAHVVKRYFNLLELPETFGLKVPGRMHKVSSTPPIYVDVAHNAQSVKTVLDHFKDRPVTLICSFKNDKDLEAIEGRFHHVIAMSFDDDMHEANTVLRYLNANQKNTAQTIEEAINLATNNLPGNGIVLCLGGFGMAGRALAHYHGTHYDVISL